MAQNVASVQAEGLWRQLRLARGCLTNARGIVRGVGEDGGEGDEVHARAFSLYVRSTSVCKEF